MSLFESGIASQRALGFPQPLSEKYRPHKIGDFLALDKPRKVLAAFCQRPTPSAWLLVGPPGVGKSTMALAMRETLGAELHHIPSQKCTVQQIDEAIRMCWYAPMTAGVDGLEKRFLSRCRVLEFSSYGMRDALAAFLAQVWTAETGSLDGAPDFTRLAKDSTNNVRDALMRLEVELLGR